jgi:hypothetical protein
MQLDLDLGTMELDERGEWIDPGPIDGGQFGVPGQLDQPSPAPEQIPPGIELFPPMEFDAPTGGGAAAAQRAIRVVPTAYEADALPQPRRRLTLRDSER